MEQGGKFRYVYANEKGLEHANLHKNDMGKLLTEALPKEHAKHLIHYYKEVIETNDTVVFLDEIEIENGEKEFLNLALLGLPIKIIRLIILFRLQEIFRILHLKKTINGEYRNIPISYYT